MMQKIKRKNYVKILYRIIWLYFVKKLFKINNIYLDLLHLKNYIKNSWKHSYEYIYFW